MLLGASGSIGRQTIEVCLQHHDQFKIIGLSVGYNIDCLHQLLKKLTHIQIICVAKAKDANALTKLYPQLKIHEEEEGLKELAAYEDYDIMVNALVGFRGLIPTLRAIENDKQIALANKESLVSGGNLIKEALKHHPVNLYPIDSEHSAIFQCMQGSNKNEIERLLITASGGSFREKNREELQNVTKKAALKHPNWQMGARITIDSATMMNKGFEVIEAHYLFDIPYDKISVYIHKESIVHSMVKFCDQAIIAQLGSPDMALPIQYALSYPLRIPLAESRSLSFEESLTLHFEKVKASRYPLLELAFQVGKKAGNLGAVLNGADEQAVTLFLEDKITFLEIEKYIENAIKNACYLAKPSLEEIVKSDKWARDYVLAQWKGDQ